MPEKISKSPVSNVRKSHPLNMQTPVIAYFLGAVAGIFSALVAIMLYRFWINEILPVGFILVVLLLFSCGCYARSKHGKIVVYIYSIACSIGMYILATLKTGDILLVGKTITGEMFWSGTLGYILLFGSFLIPFSASLLPHKLFVSVVRTPIWRTNDHDIDFMLGLTEITDVMLEHAFLSGRFDVKTKDDGTPVTEIDQSVEHYIRRVITKYYPDDEILGEEFGENNAESRQNFTKTTTNATKNTEISNNNDIISPNGENNGENDHNYDTQNAQLRHNNDIITTSDTKVISKCNQKRRWIIDPIDGTKNFIRNVPIFATLICLEIDGKPQKSVISAPMMKRRWWGLIDGKHSKAFAQFDQYKPKQLNVSETNNFENATLAFSSEKAWGGRNDDEKAFIKKLSQKCARVRGFGDFYSYMLVAEGAADIATEPDLELYDIAALIPIVQGAGGVFTDIMGKDWVTKDGIKSSLAYPPSMQKELDNVFA